MRGNQEASSPSLHKSIGTLWLAIETAAIEREHRPADVARFIGLHAAHYYRVRKSPSQLSRCHLDVLRRIAQYID